MDGARFLRDVHHADERLVRLVANHTCALLEADERGLREELESEFPILGDQLLVDAITYSDMITSPDGVRTTAAARLAEIVDRYRPDTIVGRFIKRASPDIVAAVQRVERLLSDQPR